MFPEILSLGRPYRNVEVWISPGDKILLYFKNISYSGSVFVVCAIMACNSKFEVNCCELWMNWQVDELWLWIMGELAVWVLLDKSVDGLVILNLAATPKFLPIADDTNASLINHLTWNNIFSHCFCSFGKASATCDMKIAKFWWFYDYSSYIMKLFGCV